MKRLALRRLNARFRKRLRARRKLWLGRCPPLPIQGTPKVSVVVALRRKRAATRRRIEAAAQEHANANAAWVMALRTATEDAINREIVRTLGEGAPRYRIMPPGAKVEFIEPTERT